MRRLFIALFFVLLSGCAGATTNLNASNPALRPHAYPQSYDVVWDNAVQAATQIKSWAVTSTDKSSGIIALRKGFNLWTTGTMMAVHVHKIDDSHTQVDMQSALSGFNGILTLDYGQNKRNISRFFEELDRILATTKLAGN